MVRMRCLERYRRGGIPGSEFEVLWVNATVRDTGQSIIFISGSLLCSPALLLRLGILGKEASIEGKSPSPWVFLLSRILALRIFHPFAPFRCFPTAVECVLCVAGGWLETCQLIMGLSHECRWVHPKRAHGTEKAMDCTWGTPTFNQRRGMGGVHRT